MAAVRRGDTLVITKLMPAARDIADELTKEGVALSLDVSVYDPTDPVGRLLFNVLGMVAEFEDAKAPALNDDELDHRGRCRVRAGQRSS